MKTTPPMMPKTPAMMPTHSPTLFSMALLFSHKPILVRDLGDGDTVPRQSDLSCRIVRPRFAPFGPEATAFARPSSQVDRGSGGGTRTHNLRINSPPLCQLSYP